MSLILDALNKSDHEQERAGDVPDLHAMHYRVEDDSNADDRNKLLYLAVIGGLVLMVVVLLLVILWRRPAPPPPLTDAPAPTAVPVTADQPLETQSSRATAASNAPMPQQSIPEQPVSGRSQFEQETSQPADETQSDPRFGRQMLTPLEENVIISPPADDEVLALYQVQVDTEPMRIQEPVVKTVTPERPGVDRNEAQQLWREMNEQQARPVELPPGVEIEKLPDTPAPAPKTAYEPEIPEGVSADESVVGQTDVPFLHELPEGFQNTIPTLMYAKHAYSQGFVIINKKRYHEGDTIQGNILLEDLLADGVLLRFNDRAFKLGAESSWVNY